MAQVQVKWAGRRFGIEFADSEELSNYTVSQFKEKCQRLTGVDSQDMKLLAYGGRCVTELRFGYRRERERELIPPIRKAVMKNDQAQLRAYGIRPGSQLLLIGTVKKVSKHTHTERERELSSLCVRECSLRHAEQTE